MSETNGWKFRLAEARDSADFVQWTIANPLIDQKDVQAAKKKNNPTAMYFAVENAEGKIIGFVPIYLQILLAHLVFNPESTAAERKQGMAVGMEGLIHFAAGQSFAGNRDDEQSRIPSRKVGAGEWFDLEERQLLKFNINKLLPVPKE